MPDQPSTRIFVQIASYRDRECQWTVKDLFAKARHPERIFVGICWQTFPDLDHDCFEVETRPDQVRVLHFHARDTKGVGWARQQAQSLWQGEEYILQIDSHTRFIRNWDVESLEMLAACDSPWPVLTVYPAGYFPPNTVRRRKGPHLQCIKRFRDGGMFAPAARPVPPGIPIDRPFATAACGAGFIFGPSRMVTDVPIDPEIFFGGEETNIAVRLWTHGFDLFSPTRDLVFHYYRREESARPWDDFDHYAPLLRTTTRRLHQLCTPSMMPPGEEVDLGPYGLGSARTLEEYEAFAGINFASRTMALYAQVFPFVYSADVVDFLIRDSEVKVSPEAHLFVIEEEGFLYTKAMGRLFHLNPAAAYIWCALEAGTPLVDIEDRLVDDGLGDRAQVERQVTWLLAHLQGQGAIAGTEELVEAHDGDVRPRDLETIEPHALPGDGLIAKDYDLLDRRVRVRYQTAALRSAIDPVLANLSTGGAASNGHDLLIYQGTETDYRVVEDDRIIVETGDPVLLAFLVLSWVQDRYLGDLDPLIHLHGGLVARDDYGIVLVGQDEDSRDQLLTKMVTRGYTYYSSAVVPLMRRSLRAAPSALGLHFGEAELEARAPEAAEIPVSTAYQLDGGPPMRHVMPPADQCARAGQETDVRMVVFTRPKESGPSYVEPLDRAEGFRRLIAEFMYLPKPMSLEEAARLIGRVEEIDFYELQVHDFGEAAEGLDVLAV